MREKLERFCVMATIESFYGTYGPKFSRKIGMR